MKINHNRGKYLMCQCKLRKGDTYTTSWLPQKFANVGKYVKLKNIDGWLVESVGPPMCSSIVLERSQDYKHQRKASDI